MNIDDYYLVQSERSLVSPELAATFGNTAEEITKKVRRLLFHPCECPKNFDVTNWPRPYAVKDIEAGLNHHQPFCGNCRVFSMLSVAIMREKGIPARSRCGFATYFIPGFFEDHWIIEYKNADGKWQKADAQKSLYDVKNGEFICGAAAWKMVRNLCFDANLFGFSRFSEYGLYYVAANMIRDMCGLLKNEIGYNEIIADVMDENHLYSEKELAALDALSDVILAEDINRLDEIYKDIVKTGELVL